MSTGVDWDALASIPGTLPKPKKREMKPKEPKSRKPMKRGGPLPKENKARSKLKFGKQAVACRLLPCCVCGAPPPSDPQHTPKRSLGGYDEDCVPQCRRCHDEADNMKHDAYWTKVGVDPAGVKGAVQEWIRAGSPSGYFPSYETRR